MRLPVALQLYSVRDEMEKDFAGTVAKVKESGYEGVEFAGLFGKSAEEVKKICDDVDIIPMSAHVSLDELMSDPDGVIGTYAAIGCEFIAVPYLTEENRPGGENFAKTVENMRFIGNKCQKYGIQLLYHNHDFEFDKVDGKIGLEVLYDAVEPELLESELDLCWVRVGGQDPAKYLLKYTGRAPVVHFKDYAGRPAGKLYELIGIETDGEKESGEFTFKPIGYGVQNVPAILESSVKAGARWIVVEEDSPEKGSDSMTDVKKSIEYLKTVNV